MTLEPGGQKFNLFLNLSTIGNSKRSFTIETSVANHVNYVLKMSASETIREKNVRQRIKLVEENSEYTDPKVVS